MADPKDQKPQEPNVSDDAEIEPLTEENLDEVAGGFCSVAGCSAQA